MRLKASLAVLFTAGCLISCGETHQDKSESQGVASAVDSTLEGSLMTEQVEWPNVLPPIAEKRPVEITQHGITRVDNYAWLRDDNWQEVLKDPSVLSADIRAQLEAELTYYETMTESLEPLRKSIFDEIRGRIKEDDSSVPMRDGDWAYYRRYREGGEYPIYARRSVNADGSQGEEQILLDGDAEKGDSGFFSISSVSHSPDQTRIAVVTDRVGSERMQVEIRDIVTGEVVDSTVQDVAGGITWAADSKSFFYAFRESNGFSKKIFHHTIGADTKDDKLVFEEKGQEYSAGVGKTQSGKFIVINTGDHASNEIWVIPADDPSQSPRLFAPRAAGFQYDIDDHGNDWYIRTNLNGAVDFQLMKAPLTASSTDEWTVVEPYRQGRQISSFVTYKDYFVWMERENARESIVVADYAGKTERIAFDEPAYEVGFSSGYEYETDILRVTYESPSQPEQTFDYNMRTNTRELLKTDEVPSGHNPDLYVVEMLTAVADDGAEIPVMVFRLKTTPLDGSAPVLLNAYGSYGYFIGNPFSRTILSLVDRGVIFARAHIRGGSAKGEQWYLDGKKDKKKNSFSDFVRAGEMLVDKGYTREGRIVSYGGSAGGLLVGGALNLKPELFLGVLAAVPFVDVITTISDAALPLTPGEWEEWGNPIESAEEYGWIAEYSPYDNVKSGVQYPPVLATGGLTDYRVTYWEPAKWVARLRAETKGGPILMRMNMAAGHAGSAARFERFEEYSHLYAFALKLMGLQDTPPVQHTTE